MYAIVDIAGQQFKVEKDKKVFVHRLEAKEGSKLEFDKVLLIDNDKSVVVGTPVINGALVKAAIIDHMKGDKVIVFKKKRRKGYKVKNGHRQYMTQIVIEEIIEKGAKKAETKAAPKAEAKTTPKVETKTTPKAEAKVVTKKTEAPKAAANKKPAATKTTAKAAPKKAAKKAPATAKKTAPKAAAKKATTATVKKTTAKAAPKKAVAKKPAVAKAKPAAKKSGDKA